jgi:hypothetical protein
MRLGAIYKPVNMRLKPKGFLPLGALTVGLPEDLARQSSAHDCALPLIPSFIAI